MKLLASLFMVWYLVLSLAHANQADSASIDAQALQNKRLFFSEDQRQAHIKRKTLREQSTKSAVNKGSARGASPTELGSDDMLHYTGIVYSDRGVQLLLNGYPWLPGQLGVISARLQPETQQIEIKTTNGNQHLLLPGETVEIQP